MSQAEIQRLLTDKLKGSCAEQTRLFETKGTSDPRYCYELIRRAVFQIDDEAWHAVDTVYRPRLRRKIIRHHKGDSVAVADLTQEALLAFYNNVTPETWDRFPDLPHILRYLDTCVRSRVKNHQRNQARRLAWEKAFPEDEDSYYDVSHRVSQEIELSALNSAEDEFIKSEWRKRILALAARHCKDCCDRFLVELFWGCGLKSKEIIQRYPDKFSSASKVYKRIRNLKDRIGRDPESRALLGEVP